MPDLINVDADKMLVCDKTDHKTADNFIFQYDHAGSYIDRREAIAFFLNNKEEPKRTAFLQNALKDKNEQLRNFLLQRIDISQPSVQSAFEPLLLQVISNDPKRTVRANAIEVLGLLKKSQYKTLLIKAAGDSSYSVAGNALLALSTIDSTTALAMAKTFTAQPAKGKLQSAINSLISKYADENFYGYLYNQFTTGGVNTKLGLLDPLTTVLSKAKNINDVMKNIDAFVRLRDELPAFISDFASEQINGSMSKIATAQKAAGAKELTRYIQSKLPPDKKG